MSSCLGLYIDTNIIKYAKVTKDKGSVKVDAFGLKTYEKLGDTINQIVAETFSYKIPISVNLSTEVYNEFKIFSMLSAKDIESVIRTEFESLCEEKGQNKDAFLYRYILTNDEQNKEKIKAICVTANKADITKKMNELEGKAVNTLAPIGTSITNLVDNSKKQNVLIVNIENKTTVTTISDEKIYDIRVLDIGAGQILDSINEKENSYSKAYEICKNTTIYTNEAKDLEYEETQYLQDIMPVLYEIVGQVRKITNDSLIKINKVYITGIASVINNIDIYFQDYLTDIECDILRPYFIKQNTGNTINIKDYIEVNSAISLALLGLGEGITEVNFKKSSLVEQIKELLKIDIVASKNKENINTSKAKSKFSLDLTEGFKGKIEDIERRMILVSISIFMIIVVYMLASGIISKQINGKDAEIAKATDEVKTEITNIENDKNKIEEKAQEYQSMIENLKKMSETVSENQRYKNAIPTLLSEIMFVVPKNVQITSIENTTESHIVITARAEQYEQLGYFKGRLKTDNILTNVISDGGQKQDNVVTVTIEGELP